MNYYVALNMNKTEFMNKPQNYKWIKHILNRSYTMKHLHGVLKQANSGIYAYAYLIIR